MNMSIVVKPKNLVPTKLNDFTVTQFKDFKSFPGYKDSRDSIPETSSTSVTSCWSTDRRLIAHLSYIHFRKTGIRLYKSGEAFFSAITFPV